MSDDDTSKRSATGIHQKTPQTTRSVRELLYPVDKWTGYLWKKLHKESAVVRDHVARGQTRITTFESFAREVFARLYAGTAPRERSRPEDAWAKTLHQTLDELPAWQKLLAHCQRNKDLAAAATASVLEHVVDELLDRLPQAPPAPDPEQHRKEVRGLLDLLERARAQAAPEREARGRTATTDEPVAPAPAEELRDAEAALEAARRNGKAAIAAMAGVDGALHDEGLRTALRRTLDRTAHDVVELERAVAGFSGLGGALPSSDETQALLYSALRDADALKKLGILAGRLRQLAMGKRRARSKTAASELTNIESGNQLGSALPHELLKLTEPLLQLEFLRAFVERSLLQYALAGKEKEGRGPMVVLIDDSDSMDGAPATFARATALALADVALADKRAVRLVRFSHKLNGVLDLRPGRTRLDEVLAFMAGPTDGGTNFALPLGLARGTIESESVFERADVVLITDGEAELGWDFLSGWKALEKQTGLTTWAVHIGASAPEVLHQLTDEVVQLKDLDEKKLTDALLGRAQ